MKPRTVRLNLGYANRLSLSSPVLSPFRLDPHFLQMSNLTGVSSWEVTDPRQPFSTDKNKRTSDWDSGDFQNLLDGTYQMSHVLYLLQRCGQLINRQINYRGTTWVSSIFSWGCVCWSAAAAPPAEACRSTVLFCTRVFTFCPRVRQETMGIYTVHMAAIFTPRRQVGLV